jgi:hypothetical protein
MREEGVEELSYRLPIWQFVLLTCTSLHWIGVRRSHRATIAGRVEAEGRRGVRELCSILRRTSDRGWLKAWR